MIEPQPYKDKVTQAEANVESSKSKLAYTKASYERMQEAVKTKAISEIDYLKPNPIMEKPLRLTKRPGAS